MRLTRWTLCVVSLSALGALSCRKTVAPNTDRNRAPETYLTAAPLDSIGGGALNRAPYRFRVHWSGSDIDGQVVGYYVAVTETIPPQPPDFRPVPLPPPKPRQWVYTTSTDSVLIFSIHEGLGTDREHGLYVFAVDDEGKTDPTPAFTRFTARDQNLPGIEWAKPPLHPRAVGYYFPPGQEGGSMERRTWVLEDFTEPVGARTPPKDTIPVGASVFFEWTAFDRDWGSQIKGYRYKLVENDYVRVDDPSQGRAAYGSEASPPTPALPIGLNVFRVRAVDEAGGTTFPDSLRRFVVNYDPDTWWAGPDTTDPDLRAVLERDARGLYVPTGSLSGSVPAALGKWLGLEAFCRLPADRKTAGGRDMRTFVARVRFPTEYRFYVHVDSDTVARNTEEIYLVAGGSDKDSPYAVLRTADFPPKPEECVVGVPAPANGSPVGFEFRVPRLHVNGSRNQPAFSGIYPNFDPRSPGYIMPPDVVYKATQYFTGRAFAQVRAVDGNLGKDRRVRDPINYIDDYESGQLSEEQAKLRVKVLTWFVNFNPYFLMNVPGFKPKPNTVVLSTPYRAELYMFDPDPTVGVGTPVPFLVRARVVPAGTEPGREDGWQQPRDNPADLFSGGTMEITIPTDLNPADNPHYFEFELSDFPATSLEERRMVLVRIPFYWLTGP